MSKVKHVKTSQQDPLNAEAHVAANGDVVVKTEDSLPPVHIDNQSGRISEMKMHSTWASYVQNKNSGEWLYSGDTIEILL